LFNTSPKADAEEGRDFFYSWETEKKKRIAPMDKPHHKSGATGKK